MKKKLFVIAMAVLAAVAVTKAAFAHKDELVIAAGTNLVAGKFDPTTGYGVWAPDIFHCHLLKIGKNNELVMDLATAEKISEDGLYYTYEIRKDAKFTDGKPLTAEDVVFTFETTKAKASAADLAVMESVRAVDEHTVEFKLSKPWSIFPYVITFVGIVPKHAYTDAYGDNPLGSGAWRVVDFQKDSQLILEPNEHYYGPKPSFKRVTVLKVDEDASLAAAQSGQLDLVYVDSEYARNQVKGMKLRTFEVLGALAVNLPVIPEGEVDGKKVGNNVTCDPAVRKALNIGINRRELIERGLNGMGMPSYSVGGTLPWAAGITFEDNRVEEACKILEDAGWKDMDGDGIREKDGVKAEFTVTGRSNDMARYNTVVALAENAKTLGIHIIVKSAPWNEARNARAIPTCWVVGSSPSPSDFYLYYHSDQINRGAIGNPPSYSNKKTNELINRALNATDRAVSSENWREAETVAAEDVPFLYIAYPQNHYFVRDGLRIPEQDKLFPRGQGVSVVENMNEWTWAE